MQQKDVFVEALLARVGDVASLVAGRLGIQIIQITNVPAPTLDLRDALSTKRDHSTTLKGHLLQIAPWERLPLIVSGHIVVLLLVYCGHECQLIGCRAARATSL